MPWRKKGLFPNSAKLNGEMCHPYLMETRSLKVLKERLGQLIENKLAQWLSKTNWPIQLAAYHVSWQMPGPWCTILCWFWYSSPRHLLLATAGARHGMVPMIFFTSLRNCGYSKSSCSCLWSKVMTLWDETTKVFELCSWEQMPFALSSGGMCSSSSTITQ